MVGRRFTLDDVSVSGEEGHSTISTNYIFGLN